MAIVPKRYWMGCPAQCQGWKLLSAWGSMVHLLHALFMHIHLRKGNMCFILLLYMDHSLLRGVLSFIQAAWLRWKISTGCGWWVDDYVLRRFVCSICVKHMWFFGGWKDYRVHFFIAVVSLGVVDSDDMFEIVSWGNDIWYCYSTIVLSREMIFNLIES